MSGLRGGGAHVLTLIGLDIFEAVDDAVTDLEEAGSPADDAPALQGPLGEIPAVGLIKVFHGYES